jgi:uncharacterized protein
MRKIIALLAGLVFGAGLTLSDMINPARVLGFLDLFGGQWDPTLAFVMGGALIVMAMAWLIASKRSNSLSGDPLPDPPSPAVDARLIGGAAIFGLGWGLVGLCPGPALAAALLGGWPVWVFIASMLTGMLGFKLMNRSAL